MLSGFFAFNGKSVNNVGKNYREMINKVIKIKLLQPTAPGITSAAQTTTGGGRTTRTAATRGSTSAACWS